MQSLHGSVFAGSAFAKKAEQMFLWGFKLKSKERRLSANWTVQNRRREFSKCFHNANCATHKWPSKRWKFQLASFKKPLLWPSVQGAAFLYWRSTLWNELFAPFEAKFILFSDILREERECSLMRSHRRRIPLVKWHRTAFIRQQAAIHRMRSNDSVQGIFFII